MTRWRAVFLTTLVIVAACSGDDDGQVAAGDDVATTTTAATAVDGSSTTSSSSTTEAAGSAPAGSGDDDVEAVTTTSAGPSTTVRRGPAPTGATTTAKPTTTQAPGPATIAIENFAFQPPVLRVGAGSTVTATNKDGVSHTWTGDADEWDSGTMARDASFSRRFEVAGTFAYHCSIHTFMKGTVQVT